MKKARITFWGVRGSLPSPGPKTAKYGGNTPCVEISYEDTTIICDAGSGIRQLGVDLLRRLKNKKMTATLLLSHLHLDHVIGLPFFEPLYKQGNRLDIISPGKGGGTLKSNLVKLLSPPYFPIDISHVPASVKYNPPSPPLKKGGKGGFPLCKGGVGEFKIDDIEAEAFKCNHPGESYAFKFRFPHGKTVIYISDNEPSQKLLVPFLRWVHGADLLIHDSQYTSEQYKRKMGWGHSPYLFPISLAVKAQIKKLLLFHYDPAADDKMLDELKKRAQKFVRCMGFKTHVDLSREGMKITI